MQHNKIPTTYPSITDWFKQIKNIKVADFLHEDNQKYIRLKKLQEIIDLPEPKIYNLSIKDINQNTTKLKKIRENLKDRECFLRLIPLDKKLYKIRKKGGSFKSNLTWFNKLKIKNSQYRIEVVPRCNHVVFSAIFIVDDKYIWGEYIKGGLSNLVKGKTEKKPTIFSFDFKRWSFSKKPLIKEINLLKESISKLKVKQYTKKGELKNKLKSEFTKNNYLKGYFEISVWRKEGIQFTDYNRIQYKKYKNFDIWSSAQKNVKKIKGICASPGEVEGKIKIIKKVNKKTVFKKKEILISKNLDINFLPFMKKSGGIISEGGTILSHSSLVARELGKPYIMQVKNATKILKNGQKIRLDANKGIIEILN